MTSTSVGVGASVALNLITDTTTATIDNGVTLTGAGERHPQSRLRRMRRDTEAKMGASGGKVDIAPAIAVTLSNVTTTARVGTDRHAGTHRLVQRHRDPERERILDGGRGRLRRVHRGDRCRAGPDDRESRGQRDDGAQHHARAARSL